MTFEKWAQANGYDLTPGDPKKDLGRTYKSFATMAALDGWQMAERALERKETS